MVGNPPCIRIQTTSKDDIKYFSNLFESAISNYDIYVLFVERGTHLFNKQGNLGFILPKKFFTATYGEGLRNVISKLQSVSQIIDFDHEQVFEGATTYTCLLFLRNARNNVFNYGIVKNFTHILASEKINGSSVDYVPVKSQKLANRTWVFSGSEQASILEKLEDMPKLEGYVDNIFVGLQTSADSVYILDYLGESEKDLCLYSKSLKKEVRVEPLLFKPIISGADVKRYISPEKRQYILFPYRIINGKAELIKESEIKHLTPRTYEYLSENEGSLKGRENGRMKGTDWYGYIYRKNLERQELVKICVPRLVSRIQAVFDEKG